MINVIDAGLKFNGSLSTRSRTDALILHHAEASRASAHDIHRWHLANGWAGIGYHYYVRKDGSVYRGRPENTVGAHAGSANGYNSKSIGICFEGNYQTESMPAGQLAAGRALIADIQNRCGHGLAMLRHSDVTATDCPGQNFPFGQLCSYKQAQEEEEMQIIYKTLEDVPDWGKATVVKLLRKGFLIGEQADTVDVEHYMLRQLVINDRAGLYGI